MPGARLDLLELEDWIVGAFVVMYQRLNQGTPPPLSHAAAISGRSEKRVKASWERMRRRGWLGMAKVPHQYGDGLFGYRWRVWVPAGSPLEQLMDRPAPRRRLPKGVQPERWIAVPQQVARSRSVLAVAMYLLAHEQRMVDGAVTLTPGEAAKVLSCDRNTARRILSELGATPIRVSAGRVIYDLGVVFEGKDRRVFEIPGAHALTGYGERGERALRRLEVLLQTLDVHGVDAEAAMRDAIDSVAHATGESAPRVDLVVRLLEEQHRATLTRNPWYRHRLTLRLGDRLRAMVGGRRATRRVARVEPEPPSMDGLELRRAIASALTESCRTCDDTGWTIGLDEHGREVGRACVHCRAG